MMKRARRLRFGPGRHGVGVYRAPIEPARGAPTVVLVHGGFWKWPYNRWSMLLLQRDLGRRGWGSFNIGYRRLGRFGGGGGWPQTFDDVRSAVEMMTSGRGPDGVDPSRVVVVGHSAGGHLALVAAAQLSAAGHRAPALTISMSGPTDLERLWNGGSQPVDELTRGAPAARRWQACSPIHMLPFGVATRCVHGADDTTVPPEASMRFAAAAVEAGDDCDAVVVPGEAHRDPLFPSSAIWSSVVSIIDEAIGAPSQV